MYVIRFVFVTLAHLMILSSCALGSQQQRQPDPRLKSFHIVSSHIILLDNQAEVDGMIQNTGSDSYPFDVTIVATFYDATGHVVGRAQGIAEDVFPGMTRPFVLLGEVDSLRYSRMQLTPISLRERRYEKGLPTPPPVVP
jgi:hypothetical protein